MLFSIESLTMIDKIYSYFNNCEYILDMLINDINDYSTNNIKNKIINYISYVMDKKYKINYLDGRNCCIGIQYLINNVCYYIQLDKINNDKINKNRYELNYISNIFSIDILKTHIIGTFVKKIINENIVLPEKYNSILYYESISMIGNSLSPIKKEDLNIFYNYLGTRKKKYIRLMIHGMFYLNKDLDNLNNNILLLPDLEKICQSIWFYMLINI